jgi:hypothetical protein
MLDFLDFVYMFVGFEMIVEIFIEKDLSVYVLGHGLVFILDEVDGLSNTGIVP